MRFRTTLEQAGKTATGFEVPSTVVEGLGAGKRPAVRVTINGFTYRNTIASMGGRFMVGVSAENRAGAENFNRMREEAAGHQIERVGKQLRSMMPWIDQEF